MGFDFPASPSTGQTFTPSGGPLYTWNGYAWAPGGLSNTGFTAHKNSSQSIASATWTKLVFDNAAYNNGAFYSTTNSRYTPPLGEILLVASVWANGVLVGSDLYIGIYKNGTLFKFATGNSVNGMVQITCTDMANGTDYYEAWVQGYTASGNFSIDTGNNDTTFFQGTQPLGAVGSGGGGGGFTTGDAKLTLKTVADSGWILMDDGTIGDASSAASTRANNDCQALFLLLWNNIADSYAPVVGGRGANAAADWSAHKKITLTRQLGRALIIGGTGAGLTARALGTNFGEETHTQTQSELVQHFHQTDYWPVWGGSTTYRNDAAQITSVYATTNYNATYSQGGGASFNVMQPSAAWNIMVKL